MSLLDLSMPRLEKAVAKYVKAASRRWSDPGPKFTVRELMDTLLRRGMSERDVHAMFGKITAALEPTNCYMTHCKDYGGAGAPCNCRLERVPGRCQVLKDFRQRKVEREAAKAEEGGAA